MQGHLSYWRPNDFEWRIYVGGDKLVGVIPPFRKKFSFCFLLGQILLSMFIWKQSIQFIYWHKCWHKCWKLDAVGSVLANTKFRLKETSLQATNMWK